MFNTINLEMARAIIGIAQEERSPVIIGFAQAHLPYANLEDIAPIMVKFAREASVPVAIHFDHGMTFEYIMKAIHYGFTSVMFDGSTLDYEENIRQTKEIVKVAHALGVSVEAELGHVGGAEGGGDDGHEEMYTRVEQARTSPAAPGSMLWRWRSGLPTENTKVKASAGHQPAEGNQKRGGCAFGAPRRVRSVGSGFPQLYRKWDQQGQYFYRHVQGCGKSH